MLKSISKEYLLFLMNDKGSLTSLNDRVSFITTCIIELNLKEIIKIEDGNMYINKKLPSDSIYLLPMYNIIKYSAAMPPKELSDYYSTNVGYFNDLFDNVKSALTNENRTKEIVVESIFGKKNSYCISKSEEILKVINNIKTTVNKQMNIDEVTLIFLELLSGSGLLEKYFSHEEFNYLKTKSDIYKNNFISETEENFKNRFYLIKILSSFM